jgi:3-oxoacyl-[acyl-carrier protein] reductase
MTLALAGMVALVTGGAGGIGAAISTALARRGCHVAVHHHAGRERAVRLAGELSAAGAACHAFAADLRDADQARQLVGRVIERFGRLDILINNAGWSQLVLPGDLEGLTDELINTTLALKIHAPIYTIRAAEPHLKQSANGVVVNITSAAGHAARGSSIVYAAANAALYNLTRSLARTLAPGVRVNAVAPGFVETGFVFPADGVMGQRVAAQNYTGRTVTPDEIAQAVLFLCAEGLSITGEEIIVDGGIARIGKR